jgi:hypothetical protein
LVHFCYQIFVLFGYTLKMNINKAVYSYKHLVGSQHNTESQLSLTIRKYMRIHIVFLYIGWCLIAALAQVIFNYIPLSADRLNILIFGFLMLGAIFIMSFQNDRDLTQYLLNSNQPIHTKRRLVVCNALLGVTITWSLIVILFLPIFLTEIWLNGIEDIYIPIQYLFALLVYGFLVDFIRYISFLYHIYNKYHVNHLVKFAVYFILCFCSPAMARVVKYYIDGYILNIYNRERMSMFLVDLAHQIPINLYNIHFSIGYYILGFLVIVCTITIMMWLSKYLFYEPNMNIKSFKILKVYHYHFSLFTHLLRKYGTIREHIFLALITSYLLKLYFANNDIYEYISVLSPVFILLVSFFIHENKPDLILMLKRYRATYVKSSFIYSCYLFFQFIVFQLLFFIFGDFSISLDSLLAYMESSIFGLIVIFSVMTIFVITIYVLEGIFDPALIFSISKIMINIFITLVFSISIVCHDYLHLPTFIVKICTPALIMLIFILFIHIYQSKLRRI